MGDEMRMGVEFFAAQRQTEQVVREKVRWNRGLGTMMDGAGFAREGGTE